jgi:hypothetical protein
MAIYTGALGGLNCCLQMRDGNAPHVDSITLVRQSGLPCISQSITTYSSNTAHAMRRRIVRNGKEDLVYQVTSNF